MDSRSLPIAGLAGIFRGPILVVGGGMRAPSDLAALGQREYAAVISANGHAFRIPGLSPDFIVCKDDRHTETGESMHERLIQYHTPIIGRHWWADYRLPEWPVSINSGLMAIAVAALLGGGPIYPVGFDFFTEGTYFYDPKAPNIGRGKRNNEIRRDIVKTAELVLGTQVKPVSGPLLDIFKSTAPETHYREPALVAKYRGMQGFRVGARREFALRFDLSARILPGSTFWVSDAEFKEPGIYENVVAID